MHIVYASIESPFDRERGGGIASYLRNLIPGIVERGHTITLVVPAARPSVHLDGAVRVAPVRLPNAHWYLTKVPRGRSIAAQPVRQLEWSWAFRRAVAAVHRWSPVDVIESSELGSYLLALRPVAPLVIRSHGSDYVFRRSMAGELPIGSRLNFLLERAALWRAAAVTAPSQLHARTLEQLAGGRVRVITVPNPVNVTDVPRHSDRSEARTHTILYVGRLASVKGTETLLQAARKLLAEQPEIQIILIGPWQMTDRPERWGLPMRSRAAKVGITWLGQLPNEEVGSWYRRSTIFTMPSRYETYCISVAEAMAHGLPVVASRAGALPELITDGETGLLVPPGDENALVTSWKLLLRDVGLRRRMGNAARDRAELFDSDRVVRETLSVYESVRQS